ncbi:MAG: flagellar hook-length control protein FliK [Nitrospirae bacterium]|nr:flagellar hook-length control protein FliK [Nitrospirota bacterium]
MSEILQINTGNTAQTAPRPEARDYNSSRSGADDTRNSSDASRSTVSGRKDASASRSNRDTSAKRSDSGSAQRSDNSKGSSRQASNAAQGAADSTSQRSDDTATGKDDEQFNSILDKLMKGSKDNIAAAELAGSAAAAATINLQPIGLTGVNSDGVESVSANSANAAKNDILSLLGAKQPSNANTGMTPDTANILARQPGNVIEDNNGVISLPDTKQTPSTVPQTDTATADALTQTVLDADTLTKTALEKAAAKLAPETITQDMTTAEIKPSAIQTDDTITAAKTITPDMIAANTITPEMMAVKTIAPEMMAAKTIAPEMIAAKTIAPEMIAAKTIAPEMIAANTASPDMMAAKTIAPEMITTAMNALNVMAPDNNPREINPADSNAVRRSKHDLSTKDISNALKDVTSNAKDGDSSPREINITDSNSVQLSKHDLSSKDTPDSIKEFSLKGSDSKQDEGVANMVDKTQQAYHDAAGKAAHAEVTTAPDTGDKLAVGTPRTIELNGNKFTIMRKSDTSVEVKLEPDGIGKLNLSINVEKGVINANISASDAGAKGIIEKNLHEIVNALTKEGLTVGGFTVSLKDRGGNFKEGRNENSSDKKTREEREIQPVAVAGYVKPRYSINDGISIFA